ncbi:hypothetical protein SAMN05421736_101201 [Evansella caseinilytica]|uniref:Uncharacterized protein n=1 Tax=Evansella caseinilytica TaxID=1503961 RepID=A0A1H3GL61_9BACI|nr:hypothetical protein SAMN05421736_101201 [Evansella caseinilytica]
MKEEISHLTVGVAVGRAMLNTKNTALLGGGKENGKTKKD